jgi:hypothetical protein
VENQKVVVELAVISQFIFSEDLLKDIFLRINIDSGRRS